MDPTLSMSISEPSQPDHHILHLKHLPHLLMHNRRHSYPQIKPSLLLSGIPLVMFSPTPVHGPALIATTTRTATSLSTHPIRGSGMLSVDVEYWLYVHQPLHAGHHREVLTSATVLHLQQLHRQPTGYPAGKYI